MRREVREKKLEATEGKRLSLEITLVEDVTDSE